MTTIKLTTSINAPIETCFNLSRSIDLHTKSMTHTNEQAIAGTTRGLIGLGETVTWQAHHFGLSLKMTSRITELMYATSFTDEQVKGPFKFLKHRHIFKFQDESHTLMLDEFMFESPLGWLGRLADKYVLNRYLTQLLITRNKTIKWTAESITNK